MAVNQAHKKWPEIPGHESGVKPGYIEILASQCMTLPYTGKQYVLGDTDGFREFIRRIGKRKEAEKLKEFIYNSEAIQAVPPTFQKNLAWARAASRYGWVEHWSVDRAMEVAIKNLEAGYYNGTVFAAPPAGIPMADWEQYISRELTANLPMPLPFAPEGPNSPIRGPRKITKNESIAKMVAEVDLEEAVRWAVRFMGEDPRKVSKKSAPSGLAFKLWEDGQKDGKGQRWLIERLAEYDAERRKDKDRNSDRDAAWEDDKRRQFRVIEKLAMEFAPKAD